MGRKASVLVAVSEMRPVRTLSYPPLFIFVFHKKFADHFVGL